MIPRLESAINAAKKVDKREGEGKKLKKKTVLGSGHPGWLFYIEDGKTTKLYRDYLISHDIRIPINQPG